MDVGLQNIPRFDESVLPYIVQNFETISRAFRQLPSTRVWSARMTFPDLVAGTGVGFLPGTFIAVDVRVQSANFFMTGVFDFEGIPGSGGYAAVGLPVVNGAAPGVAGSAQAIYAPKAGEGRMTVSQTWAFSLPFGTHQVGLATYNTVAGTFHCYGTHTALSLIVQENPL